MKFSTVIAHLTKEYDRAKANKMVRKPMSYALYHTWTWVDAYEKEKKDDTNNNTGN